VWKGGLLKSYRMIESKVTLRLGLASHKVLESRVLIKLINDIRDMIRNCLIMFKLETSCLIFQNWEVEHNLQLHIFTEYGLEQDHSL
jgi:hypothetical protein